MILPKELNIVLKDDILKEVSEDLNIDIKDVNRTYDIWLKMLDYIANETDQCSIYIPNIGTMYINEHRMNKDYTASSLNKRKMKLKKIRELDGKCKYNVHTQTIPTVLKYGVASRNRDDRNEEGYPVYFTLDEIINRQKEKFFKEDIKYSDNDRLRKYFK